MNAEDAGRGHAVVFAGGSPPDPAQYEAILQHGGPSPVVIAADSGADSARALGVDVDVAVGDFDSATDSTQSWLHQTGAEVRGHPKHKDQSDLELALESAMELAPERVTVVGLGGGRVDHFLTNLMVLAHDRWSATEIRAVVDDCLVAVVRAAVTLRGSAGSLVTLTPIGGPAMVETEGLLYPLEVEQLHATGTRGLSNVMISRAATVRVTSGVVLALQPNNAEPDDG